MERGRRGEEGEHHSIARKEHMHEGMGASDLRETSHRHAMSGGMDHSMMMRDLERRFFVSMLLTLPILFLTPEVQALFGLVIEIPYSPYILLFLSTVVYLYGGTPFLKGFAEEVRGSSLGMMTLVSLAITVAYLYSAATVLFGSGAIFFWELATLIDVMLIGHWLEARSIRGASMALDALARSIPSNAQLVTDNGTRTVQVSDLRPDDKVLVVPGEKVPVDGEVVEGGSSVDESLLTGESTAVPKGPGDQVIGGSLNGDGTLTVRVTRTGKDAYVQQVIDLVRKAQESRSRTQDLADRAAFLLVIAAVAASVITLFAWLELGEGASFSVERAVTVMVISCPHALGLAIPLVVAVSTALAASSGLLIRDRGAFERARNVDMIVFDKTGTLTEGSFTIAEVVPLAGKDEDSIVILAASLEAVSEHSIARGLVQSAKSMGLELVPVDDFRSMPGEGVRGKVQGRDLMVVSWAFLRSKGIAIDEPRLLRGAEQGSTVVFLLEGTVPLGGFVMTDRPRKESKEAVSRLRSMGIKCVMLTGDNRSVAGSVARELGIDEHYAEVLPHEKAGIVKRMQDRHRVAMVGDGVNDAPALAQADIGIAIGAGTDIAIESADIVLQRNDPRDVISVIELSKKTYRKMLQNLIYATGYNVFAIPIAAGILFSYGIILTPAAGAVLMTVSTIVVAINARSLKG